MNESRGSAAESGQVCRLRYRSQGEDREIVVGETPLLIGRAQDCDLMLQHESVSRHHARVSPSGHGWAITDLDSKNGIKINTFQQNTIGVLLSGTGVDGSDGFRKIRNASGVTIAQDGVTCVYPNLTDNAIRQGTVDIVMEENKILGTLKSLVR